MRKRLAVVGHSEEGLSLIPRLEANPDVEICAILTDDVSAACHGLANVAPGLDERFAALMTDDAERVLRTQGLVAMIDADPPEIFRDTLNVAPDRGIQVTTPLIAKLLYAFGPVDATRKPDLLLALGEILEGYNLTIDRRGLLQRILQIAIGATGADRGSLMLWVPEEGHLAAEVAVGIESELIPKIRVMPGEGIAGLAFQRGEAILLHGKADQSRYQIVRERDDIESAISAPLRYNGQILGVMNLSHGRRRAAFDEEDLRFVEQLAALDAKIIARAEEYHALQRDSAQLRAQAEVRRIIGHGEPIGPKLKDICAFVSREFENGICHLYLYDGEMDRMVLHSSSVQLDALAGPLRLGPSAGIHGFVMTTREPVVLSQPLERRCGCFAVLPLIARDELVGLLSLEGMLSRQGSDLVADKISAIATALSVEIGDAMRETRMEREATRMTAITEAAAMMNHAQDSADLHRRLTSAAAMIIEAEHALLRLQDDATRQFQLRSYFGSADTDSQSRLFSLEKQISISAIQERGLVRIVDVRERPDLAGYDAGVESVLSLPLEAGGRVIGTLSLLGKVAADALATEHFSKDDETTLTRFAEHAQHALARMREDESARHQRRFDPLTGLPNASHLRERIEQEIARSAGRGRQLLVVRFQLAGLAPLLASQRDAEADRLLVSVVEELRGGLRDFDVLARVEDDTFEILLPEPDQDVSTLLGPLARRAHEAIRREPGDLGATLRLEFGYAHYPDDGQTVRQLQEKAREPRIVSD